jgi:hypothetical protein
MTCEHCQPIRDYRPANLVRLTQVPQHREWTTVRWLREAVYRGTLPHYKIGVLIYLDELDDVVVRGRVDAKLGHPVSKDDPEGEVPREPFHDCPCGCHDTARQMWGVTS